jgi:hypothetical protein
VSGQAPATNFGEITPLLRALSHWLQLRPPGASVIREELRLARPSRFETWPRNGYDALSWGTRSNVLGPTHW